MAMHLVIDGYNLIGTMSSAGAADLEGVRNELIQRLVSYKKIKGCRITVVFDGKRSGNFHRSHASQSGIDIVYSRDGEEADQILKEMAKAERQKMTLITSDRDVASFAESCGAVTIPSHEYEAILSAAAYHNLKGTDSDEDAPVIAKKSGNPRKLSRKERKRLQRMRKL